MRATTSVLAVVAACVTFRHVARSMVPAAEPATGTGSSEAAALPPLLDGDDDDDSAGRGDGGTFPCEALYAVSELK